jgi:hypothetical protein
MTPKRAPGDVSAPLTNDPSNVLENPPSNDFVKGVLDKNAIFDRDAYDRATAYSKFTRDINDSLDAIIRDETLTCAERFMPWLKRRAWGNYRLYAIRADGQPATQADCARELNVTRQCVSGVVSLYQQRGLIEDGKRLVPVISPKGTSGKVVKDALDKLEFEEWWAVNHADDKLAFDLVEAEYNLQRKSKRAAHKKYMASRRGADPFLIESLRVTPEEDADPFPAPEPLYEETKSSSSSVSSEPTTTKGTANEKVSTPPDPDAVIVFASMREYKLGDLKAAENLLKEIAEIAPDADVPDVCRVIHEKAPLTLRKGKGTAYLCASVRNAFTGDWRVMTANESPPGDSDEDRAFRAQLKAEADEQFRQLMERED